MSLTAQAGGPKLIGSPSFGVDGQPFVWDNSQTIQYRTDSGALGPMDNGTANSNLAQAFAAWTQVPTASLSVQNVGTILGVTNGHVSSVADFNTVAGSCSNGAQSPVIYDSNGTIFSQLIGDASVVGFTSICNLNTNGHIQSALIVLTGGAELNTLQQKNVMTHEIGHLFGLDHSLPGDDPCGTSTDDIKALPIIYFQLEPQTGLSEGATRNSLWTGWAGLCGPEHGNLEHTADFPASQAVRGSCGSNYQPCPGTQQYRSSHYSGGQQQSLPHRYRNRLPARSSRALEMVRCCRDTNLHKPLQRRELQAVLCWASPCSVIQQVLSDVDILRHVESLSN